MRLPQYLVLRITPSCSGLSDSFSSSSSILHLNFQTQYERNSDSTLKELITSDNKKTMVSSILLQQSINCFICNYQLGKNLKNGFAAAKPNSMENCKSSRRIGEIKARAAFDTIETATSPTAFPFFQTESQQEDTPASKLELADPEFYKMGFVRSMRAYGVEFREGPNGFGVYASRDIEPTRRAKVVMEIPLELMLTISQKTPWMFFPDIIPVGHPIFDIINSTNPETDWDLRMACLLLYAFDHDKNFWQLYGDFLPSAEECTSLLLATEDDLQELHDENLASNMRKEKARALEFWEKNWHSAMPLKVKRLAREPERFIWAVSMAQTRHINFRIRVGSLVQDANMFAPYADMLNHSCQPNCFFHWRFRDRMFEVMTNAGQRIKKGEEMTVNYMSGQRNNMLMQRYGLSSPSNPWDVLPFSGNARIHLDSFLSVFHISGSHEDYYHNAKYANEEDNFVDGAVLAAARTLPTWSEGDIPSIPSLEIKAAKALQEECQQILSEYSTTSKQDQQILDSSPEMSCTREAAIKYRLHKKLFVEKVIQALDIYQDSILF